MKKTILMDFDGVIHSFSTNNWEGIDIIKGRPVEGMRELIKELRENYEIIIYSSRCLEEKGIKAIREWVKQNDIVVDGITDKKLSYASIIVDDRCINFDGSSSRLKKAIENFKPWHK